jgi:DNA-binding transcriptional ArsR family regulator
VGALAVVVPALVAVVGVLAAPTGSAVVGELGAVMTGLSGNGLFETCRTPNWLGAFPISPDWFEYYRTMPRGQDLPHPDIADVALTDVLFALSDPARLQIVRDLADGPLEMAQCGATNPALPKSTKSHLMKVLREAGVIRNEPQGRQRLVSLRREELDASFPGLIDSGLGPRG